LACAARVDAPYGDDGNRKAFGAEQRYASDSFWAGEVKELLSLTEVGNSVYFLAEAGIIRYDKLTDTMVLVVRGSNIRSFRISDGQLYYSNDKCIYRTDMHGGKRAKVVTSGQAGDVLYGSGVGQFEVYRGVIYIMNTGTSMVRYSEITQQAEWFSSDISSIAFLGDYFYYIDHGKKSFSIFRQDLETGQVDLIRGNGESKRHVPREQWSSPEMFDTLVAVNGQLYYCMRWPGDVFKLEDCGYDTEIDRFCQPGDAEYIRFASTGSTLYFYVGVGSYEGHLFRYDTETGVLIDLCVVDNLNHSFTFKLINGYLFYYNDNRDLLYLAVN